MKKKEFQRRVKEIKEALDFPANRELEVLLILDILERLNDDFEKLLTRYSS